MPLLPSVRIIVPHSLTIAHCIVLSSGGDPTIVLIGYISNAALLALFANFYHRAYVRKPGKSKAV